MIPAAKLTKEDVNVELEKNRWFTKKIPPTKDTALTSKLERRMNAKVMGVIIATKLRIV